MRIAGSSEPSPVLTTSALYRLLCEEFERQRPASCSDCVFPVPVPIPSAAYGQPNWVVPKVRRCDHGCDITIAGIWINLRARYHVE